MAVKHDQADAANPVFVDDGGMYRHEVSEEYFPYCSLLMRRILREDTVFNDYGPASVSWSHSNLYGFKDGRSVCTGDKVL